MLSLIKFGPGGIRTHDQRIMSLCATAAPQARDDFKYSIVPATDLQLGNHLATLGCATFLSQNLTFSQLLFGRVPQARDDL